MNVHRALVIGRGFALALCLAGCGSAESSDSTRPTEEGSGAGGGGSGGEAGAASSSTADGGGSASTASSTSAASSTSSASASSGAGGSMGQLCAPGSTQSCYSGPSGTQGVGACVAGIETCNADGSAYGPCVGEVVPAAESCLTAADDDCDGAVNEEGAGCVCVPNTTASCYSGPAGTEGVGICAAGSKTCDAMGTAWGPCAGEVLPEAEDCGQPEDEDCNGVACSASLWSKIAGDVSDQYARAVGIDSAGNVYVTGEFAGGIDLGGGPLISAGNNDIYVAKLDPAGALVWSKRFGSASGQTVYSIAVSPAGLVTLAGSTTGTFAFGASTVNPGTATEAAYVARLDADGNAVWAHELGYSGISRAYGVTVDSTGNTLIVGTFDACLYLGAIGCGMATAGGQDVYIAKYDAAGTFKWAKKYGDANHQSGKSIATDSAGNILVAGDFKGTIAFGGTTLTDSGVNGDMFVAKLDASGNSAWAHRYGGSQVDTLGKVAFDASGNIAFVGNFLGSVDFGGGALTSGNLGSGMVAKLSPAGVHLWSKATGAGNGTQYMNAVAFDADGNVLLAGAFSGSIAFGSQILSSAGFGDSFVAKIDPQGTPIWSKRFGDNLQQHSSGVAAAPSGDIVVAGAAQGTTDFGSGPLASAGGYDAVIAAFAP